MEYRSVGKTGEEEPLWGATSERRITQAHEIGKENVAQDTPIGAGKQAAPTIVITSLASPSSKAQAFLQIAGNLTKYHFGWTHDDRGLLQNEITTRALKLPALQDALLGFAAFHQDDASGAAQCREFSRAAVLHLERIRPTSRWFTHGTLYTVLQLATSAVSVLGLTDASANSM